MIKNFTKAFSSFKKACKRKGGGIKLSILVAMFHVVAVSAFAQSGIKIAGTIKDTKGEPLPGVSVKVKGSATGVNSSVDGKYTINVPGPDAVLEFTFVGFTSRSEKVGSRTVINVSLNETSSSLEEVVVTGYGGTAKKRDLAGATASVSSKDIQERQPVNIFDALQGKAAGVLVVNDGGGAPGAEGSIQIRGVSTLNGGNGPLYLVDGVINPNGASINPMDIESIEVLKDAASASIYGARAANGVILITTKKGQDGKPRVDAQYVHTFGKLANKLPQNNSAEVRAFRRLQTPTDPNTGGNIDSLNPGFNSDNDLQDLLLGQTAQKDQVNLGLSGGTKGFSYYAGVNYLDDKSIILNSWMKRIQSRVNIDYQLSKKLKYGNNISFNWQDGNEVPLARTVNVAFDRPAYSRIYYPDGSLTSYIGSKRNPVANALYDENKTEVLFSQFNNRLEYSFYQDLKWTNMFNINFENRQINTFSPRFVDDNRTDNFGVNGTSRDFRWEFQSFLNYNKTIKDHAIKGLLGFSADKRRFDESSLRSEDAVSEEIRIVFPSFLVPSQSYTRATANTGLNVFSRLDYSYKGKYILGGVFRRDGSSRFGTGNRYGNFYSVAAAWRFSDESFMKWSKKALYDGKLRFSYGTVGNDRIGDYEQYTRVGFSGLYNGLGGAGYNTTLGNPKLQWETNKATNLGLELSFLQGRLTFTGDVYDKTTYDLLYSREFPKETGFTNVSVNVGSIQNRGLELVVGGTPISSALRWDVNANITFERGTIKELADGVPFIAGNKWYVEEGGRVGSFYGWKNLGVYRWDASNAYSENGERLEPVNVSADGKTAEYYTLNGQQYSGTIRKMLAPEGVLLGGDTQWRDVNGDFLINDSDRHIIGNAQPDFYFGFYNNLSYKSISLSFLFNGSFGGEVYNTLQYNANYPSATGAGSPMVVYNSWRRQGDEAILPYYVNRASRGSLKQHGNSLYIEDASFIRLSSMRLTYSVPQRFLKNIFVKRISGFIWGSNLVTWTNYTGYDPEFSANNPLTPGDDTGKYPKRRELGLGLNVNF